MEHLLSVWQKVAPPLKAAKHIMLLSDYDGTLTPIVERPELAHLSEGTRVLLQALVRQPAFTVGIISGRALRDLKDRVNIKGIIYAGNHGLEVEGGGVHFVNPVAAELKPLFQLLYQALHTALRSIKGVLVEDKGLTLSVHYRLADQAEAGRVRSILERVLTSIPFLGKMRMTPGKKVYEARPAVDWDKGKAVALLLEKHAGREKRGTVLPLFLGDDLTDEAAFAAVESWGGISIFVGEEKAKSRAGYFLRSSAEVAELLSRLLDIAQRGIR